MPAWLLRRSDTSPSGVVAFWRKAGPDRWFDKEPGFDQAFRERYYAAHMAAAAGRHDDWGTTPAGLLALLILLDQYPRNSFRGTAHMYATDVLARRYAHAAADPSVLREIEPDLRLFAVLPFSHSEDPADQDISVDLMRAWSPQWLTNAEEHRSIIRRFGRFPHRNRILLREPTAEEERFLKEGGYAG